VKVRTAFALSATTYATDPRTRKKEQNKTANGRKLGGDNHLAVVLSKYEPTVSCEGENIPVDPRACAAIQYDMDAETSLKFFGDPLTDPDAEERLPYTLIGRRSTTPVPPYLGISFETYASSYGAL